MKIEKSQCEKLEISGIDGLDPITVFLEDFGPRKGQITIKCWNEVWSSYWGGMGDRNIAQFFCSCDHHYLAKNLSDIPRNVTDFDGLPKHARKFIGKLRAERDISKDEAKKLLKSLLDYCGDPHTGEEIYNDHQDILIDIYGDDWSLLSPTSSSNIGKNNSKSTVNENIAKYMYETGRCQDLLRKAQNRHPFAMLSVADRGPDLQDVGDRCRRLAKTQQHCHF